MQKVNEQYLTCAFRLHDPTVRKQAILDNTFSIYTASIQTVLDWAHEHLTEIEQNGQLKNKDGELTGKYNARSLSYVIPSSGQWAFKLPGCLKESVVKDACSMVSSYLELRKLDKPGFINEWPTALRVVSDERSQALEGLRSLVFLDDNETHAELVERENELRSALYRRPRQSGGVITFVRERDCELLFDPDNDRLFLLLPVAQGDFPPTILNGNLINVNTGERVKGRRSSDILFPVELGLRHDDFFWQYQKFIGAAIKGTARIVSAKLLKREDGYFLNASFAFPCPPVYEHVQMVGVSRMILRKLSFSSVDLQGRVLRTSDLLTFLADMKHEASFTVADRQQRGLPVGRREYKFGQRKNNLHNLANHVIEMARLQKAMIVCEAVPDSKVVPVSKKAKWWVAPWREFCFILGYKSALAGVPFRDEMFSAKAYVLCPECGGILKKIRGEQGTGRCVVCGAKTPYVAAASINLARRVLYKKKDWENKGGYLAFHQDFAKY